MQRFHCQVIRTYAALHLSFSVLYSLLKNLTHIACDSPRALPWQVKR